MERTFLKYNRKYLFLASSGAVRRLVAARAFAHSSSAASVALSAGDRFLFAGRFRRRVGWRGWGRLFRTGRCFSWTPKKENNQRKIGIRKEEPEKEHIIVGSLVSENTRATDRWMSTSWQNMQTDFITKRLTQTFDVVNLRWFWCPLRRCRLHLINSSWCFRQRHLHKRKTENVCWRKNSTRCLVFHAAGHVGPPWRANRLQNQGAPCSEAKPTCYKARTLKIKSPWRVSEHVLFVFVWEFFYFTVGARLSWCHELTGTVKLDCRTPQR